MDSIVVTIMKPEKCVVEPSVALDASDMDAVLGGRREDEMRITDRFNDRLRWLKTNETLIT